LTEEPRFSIENDMAYDEVMAYEAEERFRAEFPTFVALNIIVESNPHHFRQYGRNTIRKLLLTYIAKFIGNDNSNPKYNFCANKRCMGAQINLIELFTRAYVPHGGVLQFDEHVKCLGVECRRRSTIIERAKWFFATGKLKDGCNNFWYFDSRLPRIRCDNILRISGAIEFKSSLEEPRD
jgi:hypothetical protein